MSRLVVPGLVLLLAAAGGAACRTARAATPVERPNLDVPPPPARVVEPAPPVEEPPTDPVGEVPTAPASGTASRPRPQRDSGTSKPDAKPEMPPEPPPSMPPPSSNPTQLRAPGMASPETAGQIRAILDRANGTLGQIDYTKLTKPRQASYDTAKRFADEGDKELRAANYVLAKELAEKAERLARELQVR